jgi:pyruvate/2-oxoglutarate dehydrogenase complex dihydrolipoamide dehydrogenase (E3) component
MAQAFRRLGAAVALVERGATLPRDEPEAVALLRATGLTDHLSVATLAAPSTRAPC